VGLNLNLEPIISIFKYHMNSFNDLAGTLSMSASGVGSSLTAIAASVLVAVIVFVVGWLIGILVSKVVEKIIKSIKLDALLKTAGVDSLVHKMGLKLNSGKFIGEIARWYVVVVVLIVSFDIIGLNHITAFLANIAMGYLPKVIAAVLILIIAAVIAEALKKVIVASAKGAGVASANFAGSVAKWAIWISAILAALIELQIATTFIQTIFTGLIVALAIALGLSFGLGGQDAARDYIAKVRSEIKKD
jgi:hypothetical protein